MSCEHCNYPLADEPTVSGSPASHGEPAPTSSTSVPSAPPVSPEKPLVVERPLPRRPRRQVGPFANQSLSLWLLFAVFAAGALIFEAVRANLTRTTQQVEGSSDSQQKLADQARDALAHDSTNVEAHIALGNVLFDTGNWAEAAEHYQVVLRRDSTRVAPMVDLGVCYYNLGQADQAERTFERALAHDPHQPVALFNLGIVNERRGNDLAALHYYHRALETGPADELKSTIVAAVQRMQEKTGRRPAPLPGGGGQ